MLTIPPETISAFIDTCHAAGRRGLVQCSSGNLSCRLDETRMLATASGSWLEDIRDDQLSICRIDDATLIEGPPPTVEAAFHAGILKHRPDVNVVFHFQTPYATLLACGDPAAIDYFVIPEIPVYMGAIGHVPYLRPGSPALAAAVVEAGKKHDMIILASHGMVTVGKNDRHVIQNAVFFEFACRLIVEGRDTINPLSAEAIEQLTSTSGKA
ncbi:MAG: class II aldolase/adducin family protein [Lentisphaeria bacterium]|nr:class II aldolase/adducin family protein [Lentisphaeria bacterium]